VTRLVWAAIVVVLVSAAACAAAAPAAHAGTAANERELLELINDARVQRGLARLTLQPALDAAAGAHSREMIRRQYFAHSSASGASCATRLAGAGYRRSGWATWGVSEVLGWGRGTRDTPQAVLRGWLGSPVHRPIILGARWRDVGVGCVRGTYQGRTGALMYTVDLGRRTR
jgi:uncharacterized protein YkwD